MTKAELLKDILITTKDGDWGKDEPKQGFVPYRVIRGADFPQVRIGETEEIPICYLDEKTVSRRTLIPQDIIIETAGGNRDRPTGRTLFVTEKLINSLDLPVTCASFCRFLRVNPEKAEPGYIYWYLQNLYQNGEMWNYQVQHTGVARFQYTKFAESIKIPLPPIEEQKAIAKILSSLDDKIVLNQQMNATLEAMARALFKAWFVDFEPAHANLENRPSESASPEIAKLFPSEFENSIPKGWDVKKLGEVLEAKGGTTPSTKNSAYWNGDNYWATPKDLSNLKFPVLLSTERKITDEGVRQISSGILPKGTLLLSSRAPIGYLSIAQIPVSINQGFIAIQPKKVSNLFMLYWLMQHMEAVKSRANGSTFQEISKSSFREIEMIFADNAILRAFDEIISPLFERIISNEKENQKLEQIRNSLLPRLISGKLSVGETAR